MTCAYPHCNLPEDHDGPHLLAEMRSYACENCTWFGDYQTGREAMWHAAENGHNTYDVATRASASQGDRLPPLPPMDWEEAALQASEEADGYEADETGLTPADPAPELGRAAIEKAHRRYAFGQLKATRNNMARDLHRDIAAGKFTNEAMLWRAQARLKSYDDLITLLETLKDMIK